MRNVWDPKNKTFEFHAEVFLHVANYHQTQSEQLKTI